MTSDTAAWPCARRHVEIARQIDGRAVGQRQRVEIGQQRPGRRPHHGTAGVAEHDAVDGGQVVGPPAALEHGQQRLHGGLALAHHHHVGAGRQVVFGVVRRIGSTDHHPGAGLPRGPNHAERVALGHQVHGDADHGRPGGGDGALEVGRRLERGIEDADIGAGALESRRDVEQPQRRMGPHDAAFLRILGEVVGVGQQHVHHDTRCGGRRNSTTCFSTGQW
ncbi:MAG: hypothetical protein R2708_12530 [Vicinamibacterales bacterium]